MSNQNQKKMRKLAARAASASMRAASTSASPAKRPTPQPKTVPYLTEQDLFTFSAEDFERAAQRLRRQLTAKGPSPISPPPASPATSSPPPQRGEFRPLFSCPRTGDPATLSQRARATFRDQLLNHPRGYQPRHMLGIWPLRVGGQGLPFILPV